MRPLQPNLKILLFLLFSLASVSIQQSPQDIDFNKTKEISIQTDNTVELFKLSYSSRSVLSSRYLHIFTSSVSEDEASTASNFYISQKIQNPTETENTFRDYQLELYLPKDILDSKTNYFFISVYCSKSCSFKLSFKLSNYVSLKVNKDYSYLTYSRATTYNTLRFNLYDNLLPEDKNKKMWIYIVGGYINDLDANIEYFKDSNESEGNYIDVHPNLYNGYVGILDMNEYELSTGKFHIAINSVENSYITIGIRPVNEYLNWEYSDKRVHYGFLKDNDSDCFYIKNIDTDKPTISVNIISHTHNLAVFFEGAEGQFTISDSTSIKANVSELKTKSLCFKLNDKLDSNRTYTAYSFVIDSDDQVLINGMLYNEFVWKTGIKTYRHSKYDITSSHWYMHLQVKNGDPVMYAHLCTTFPICVYTEERIQEWLDTKKWITSSKLNGIYSWNVKKKTDVDNLNIYSPNQYYIIVHCKSVDTYCHYTINYNGNKDIVMIGGNEKYEKYILKGSVNRFQFTNILTNIKKVFIYLFSYTGDAQLSISQSPQGKDPVVTFYSKKTIIEYSTNLVATYDLTISSPNSNGYYYIVYHWDNLGDEEENVYTIRSGSQVIEVFNVNTIKKLSFHKDNRINNIYGGNCEINVMKESDLSLHGSVGRSNGEEDNNYWPNINGYVQEYFGSSSDDRVIYSVSRHNTEWETEKDCMIYVSGVTDEVLINDDAEYKMLFKEGEVENIKYIYPYCASAAKDNIVAYFQTTSNVVSNNRLLNWSILINDNSIGSYTFSYSRSFVISQNEWNKCNDTNEGVCKITLVLSLIKQTPSGEDENYTVNTPWDTLVTVRLKTSSMQTPAYLPLNRQLKIIQSFKHTRYFQTDIRQNTSGEILFSFLKGSGKIYARILDKKTTEDQPNFNNRIILPHRDSIDLLNYDEYTNKIVYNKHITSNCENDCVVYITVESSDQYSSIDVEEYIEYYIVIKEEGDTTKLTNDRSVYDNVGLDKINFYSIYNYDDTKEPTIHFQGRNVTMLVNVDGTKPTKEKYFQKYETRNGNTFLLKDVTLKKNWLMTIGVYTDVIMDMYSTAYHFSVETANNSSTGVKGDLTMIKMNSHYNHQCKAIPGRYCYYAIPIYDYYNYQIKTWYFHTSPTDNSEINMEKLSIYANIITVEEYDSITSFDDLENHLPKKDKCEYTSTTNYINISLKYIFKEFYVVLGVYYNNESKYKEEPGSTYPEFMINSWYALNNNWKVKNINKIYPQLFYLEKQKSWNFFVDNSENYVITIDNPLVLTANVNFFNDRTFAVVNDYKSLSLFSNHQKKTLSVTNTSTGDYVFVMTPRIRSSNNYDEIELNKQYKFYYSRNRGKVIYFYMKLNDEFVSNREITLNINTDVDGNTFVIEGFLLNEKEVTEEVTRISDASRIIKGTYDSTVKKGFIKFTSAYWKQEELTGKYVLISITMGTKYEAFSLNVSSFVKGELNTTPVNEYQISDSNDILYKLSKVGSAHKFFRVDLYNTTESITWSPDSLHSTNSNTEGHIIHGRTVLIREADEQTKHLYWHVTNSVLNKPYVFKYQTAETKEEILSDLYKYMIKDKNSTITFSLNPDNLELLIAFNPIVEGENKVKAKYYVRLYDGNDNNKVTLIEETKGWYRDIVSEECELKIENYPKGKKSRVHIIGEIDGIYFYYDTISVEDKKGSMQFYLIIGIVALLVIILIITFLWCKRKKKEEGGFLKMEPGINDHNSLGDIWPLNESN